MKRGLGHSLGGNEGNTQECENASQFWGKRIANPTWIFFFFYISQQRAFLAYYKLYSLLINFETLSGCWA